MIKDKHLKRFCLIWLAMFVGTMLAMLAGCATSDTARYVERNCPTKRVEGAEAYRVVRERILTDDKHVYIVGNCWRDAQAVAEWCRVQGIKYEEVYEANHVYLRVNGKRIEYIDGVGLVAR